MSSDDRRVIFASSLGTAFEWYDFYLYGSLATIIAAQFFPALNGRRPFWPRSSLSPPASMSAARRARFDGSAIVGRKYTFLVTSR